VSSRTEQPLLSPKAQKRKTCAWAAAGGCAVAAVLGVAILVLASSAWLRLFQIDVERRRPVVEESAERWFALAPSTSPPVAWEVRSSRPYTCLGASLAALGDVNGDGWDDVAVSAVPLTSILLPIGPPDMPPGRVLILSGADGRTLAELELQFPDDDRGGEVGLAFGASLANVGDLDRDGFSDLAVGAPVDSPARLLPRVLRRLVSASCVFVVSGATREGIGYVATGDAHFMLLQGLRAEGDARPWFVLPLRADRPDDGLSGEIWRMDGLDERPTERLDLGLAITAIAAPGDLDGDGRPDVLLLGEDGARSQLEAISLHPQRVLYRLDTPRGLDVATLEDTDQDRVPDFALAVRPEAETVIEIRSGRDGRLLPTETCSGR
jgi:FG-GAP repeat